MTQQEKPSARVLARMLALARAEGLEVRTQEEEARLPYGAPPGVSFKPESPTAEQVLEIAWSFAGEVVQITSPVGFSLVREEQNEMRIDRFTAALLANLYAAEALALPLADTPDQG